MKIVTTPTPSLREKSKKVRELTPEIRDLIAKMRESSLAWEKQHQHELSAAMAAPQLGQNYRIIIVRDDLEHKENNSFTALINPEVIRTEGKVKRDFEGCLSVPSIYGKVPRPHKVKIKALTEDGHEVRVKADGYLARVLMHEIDHLNGILFIDHIKDDEDAFYYLDDKDGEIKPLDYDKHIKDNPDLWSE